MAQFSLVTLFMVVAIAACRSAWSSRVIEGSISTVSFDTNNNHQKSVLSKFVSFDKEESNSVKALDNRPELPHGVDNGLIRFNLPLPVFSGMNRGSAFIRRKRQACKMTRRLAQNLSQLFSGLNDTMFLGLTPQQPSVPRIPVNQSAVCPNSSDLSSTENRLRSICPWNLSQRDLGANSYPRYVAEATCMCTRCIGISAGNRCEELITDVTYFVLDTC